MTTVTTVYETRAIAGVVDLNATPEKAEEIQKVSTARGPRVDAIKRARQFVNDNSFCNLNTSHQSGKYEGFPVSQIEYYIDSGDSEASLLMIRVDMSTAFRNIKEGSPASVTIRTGDSPNAISPTEMAASQRIILYGIFEACEPDEDLVNKFFEAHPDAREWEPGMPGFHRCYWVKFVISGIYYIGGFGDRNFIGQIPVEKYITAPINTTPAQTSSETSVWSRLASRIF